MARTVYNDEGINELIQTLQRLANDWEEIAGRAVYEGTAIVADKVRSNIQALPVTDKWGTEENPRYGVTQVEKQGLLDGFGVADMKDFNGFINTLSGFDDAGYNADGKANRLIARATQSGTTFSKKIPFFKNAVASSRGAAEQKMREILEREIERLSQG